MTRQNSSNRNTAIPSNMKTTMLTADEFSRVGSLLFLADSVGLVTEKEKEKRKPNYKLRGNENNNIYYIDFCELL